MVHTLVLYSLTVSSDQPETRKNTKKRIVTYVWVSVSQAGWLAFAVLVARVFSVMRVCLVPVLALVW